jgi:hypothetical protein
MKHVAFHALLASIAAAAAVGVGAPPATAGGGCGSVSISGHVRYVEAAGVSCEYARHWSVELAAGHAPGGWDRCWAGPYRGGCERGSGSSHQYFGYHP